jgi:hypothetical protein
VGMRRRVGLVAVVASFIMGYRSYRRQGSRLESSRKDSSLRLDAELYFVFSMENGRMPILSTKNT